MSTACQYKYHNMYTNEFPCPVCYDSGYIRPVAPRVSILVKKFLVLIRLYFRSMFYVEKSSS